MPQSITYLLSYYHTFTKNKKRYNPVSLKNREIILIFRYDHFL